MISPLILRERKAGQIDLARIKNGIIEISEVKSKNYIGASQTCRLKNSAKFLGILFQLPVNFKLNFDMKFKD